MTAAMKHAMGIALLMLAPAETLQAVQPPPRPAMPSELVANVSSRHALDLSGKWRAIIDPYEIGYYDYRYEPRDDGFFLNATPQDKSDRVEYDFDASETLEVP